VKHRSTAQRKPRRVMASAIAVLGAVAIAAAVVIFNKSANSTGPLPVHLPAKPESYLGVFVPGVPASYSALAAFSRTTGTNPDVDMYYSGWFVPFPAKFAATVANHGAVPLVQMDPDGIDIAKIAAGRYDAYLSSYAEAVRAYRDPVILGFGHEMNGTWYSWGYRHTPPEVFVAAWRHVVGLFRDLGARNVTWLWTVNIINDTSRGRIPSPAAWWPGNSYVNWVGIDGYYLKPSWKFASLFGPTIGAVHRLTQDPILIAETGAVPAAEQPAKVADLFAGVHLYGLLGFVWFDAKNTSGRDFRLNGAGAVAAFRKGAAAFKRP
jgi:mannan endo-1,4-beta-mannosidase